MGLLESAACTLLSSVDRDATAAHDCVGQHGPCSGGLPALLSGSSTVVVGAIPGTGDDGVVDPTQLEGPGEGAVVVEEEDALRFRIMPPPRPPLILLLLVVVVVDVGE